MISFRKEETPLSSRTYAWSSEETKNNGNIICEYSVGKYIKQEIEELQRENERLNNTINELEKWLNDEIYRHEEVYKPSNIIFIENGELHKVLDKLKELKGSDKE